MKLDTGKAWSDAVSLVANNRDAILAVGGLFFFLPSFALFLLVPEAMAPQEPPVADGADFDTLMEAMQATMVEHWANYWWVTALITLLQWFGMLALMALMSDHSRPTVGEAMGIGGRGLLPYIAAQLIVIFGVSLGVGVPLGLLSALGGALGLILLIFAIPLMVYVFVKVTLVPAVIAIEGEGNPVAALKRSWSLTKGNSFTIFLFLFLLILAAGIVALLVNLVLATVFVALGGTMEQIGLGFVESLISAAIAIIVLAAVAAIHRQLAGPSDAEVSDTFE